MKKKATICACIALAAMFIMVLVLSVLNHSSDNAAVPTMPAAATVATVPTTAVPDKELTLSFVGDCILGSDSGEMREGNFTWYAANRSHDYFFSEVYGVLSKDDITFANCECVLSDDKTLEKTGKDYDPAFWFIAGAKNADILSLGSVESAGVVNNHTDDYGAKGYADTVQALRDAGVTPGEECEPVYFDKNGIKIGIVYCSLWGDWQKPNVVEALKGMQTKCDYKIVFFHGGEEAIHSPDSYKITVCRELAESGLCDLIVGSHPHVLQPMEVVNGVPIVYSIGNFCFAGNNYPENKTVIFQATVRMGDNGKMTTDTNIIPCYVFTGDRNNWQPAVVTDSDDKEEILAMMSAPVDYPSQSVQTTAAQTEPQADASKPESALGQIESHEQSDTVVAVY